MPFNVFLIFASIPFQLAALVFAVAMIRHTVTRRPWILLTIAVLLMLAYRVIAVAGHYLEIPELDQATPVMQAVAAANSLVISIFLFASLLSIRTLSVSERKAIGALRVSEEQFRQLADSMPLLAWVSRPDGYAEYFNQRWFDFTGTTLELSHGDGWLNCIHIEDRPVTIDRWRNCLLSGQPFEVEYRCRRASDGAYLWHLARCLAVRDEKGHIVKWVGTCTDIDDQKRLGERFRENANTIETINFVGRALVSELDLSKLVQTVTDAATGLIGAQFGAFFYSVIDQKGESHSLYSISGLPRQDFEQLALPRNKDLLAGLFKEQRVIRVADMSHDQRQNMPLGHLPARSYMAAPVISRSGELLGGLFFGHRDAGVFRERDEQIIEGIAAQAAIAIDNARLYETQQRARAEAESASRIKDEFLATLSHELRTPLNAILGYSHLLRKGKIAPDELSESIAIIERNARAQTQIMEDLLDMSRIISGKIRLDMQRVQPAAAIEAAAESLKPAADAKGLRIERQIDPLAPMISADPNRLQQIFWNLLSNAIKFTPRGGSVYIQMGRAKSQLQISFADTGEGISSEFLPHVFERFRQADASTTRRHGGLGLGLSIVKQLVELHGGTVWAKSPGPGMGATFTISLPIAAVQVENDDGGRRTGTAELRKKDFLEPPPLVGVRALIVDDEPDARSLIRRVLEDCGATVFCAASAQEALEMLGKPETQASVVLSDIGMPHMDGYDLIHRIRALPADSGGAIPAVALTAFARTEDRTRALLAGYQMHVVKPVDPNELVATVATLAAMKIAPAGIIGSAAATISPA
ncbi:MAG TPA: ATP-binding protein [Tepidisphaeraceae bacterium]|nr:ATP-binding protein [Tepidisphaeraceae bacterium]